MTIRVLVVDDSAFARKVVREVLSADPRIEVIGTARDGLDALEKIAELTPDVVTLDLVMPQLDGVGVLDALRERESPPRVVIVTMADSESPLGVAALAAGAFDVVQKPTALATDRLYELGAELVEKVVVAATAPRSALAARPVIAPPKTKITPARTKIVVIGASTGGPHALTLLLRALPAEMPVPVAIVLHMPAGYTEAFAARLDRESAITVREASDGGVATPGEVVIARAGIHLRIGPGESGACSLTLDVKPLESLHRPSVDTLFTSAAAAFGSAVLGVVLTGMGSDGLVGARAIHAAGGRILVEDPSTCVVYGMPRVVAEENLAHAKVPLYEMAAAILDNL